jgi:hypothetical protein
VPFIESEDDAVLANKLVNLADRQDEERPAATDIASALWRQENIVGSILAQEPGLPSRIDDRSFNPWDYLTDEEKLNETFVSNATLADSVEEIEAIRRQSEREKADRDTIAKGGALSFAIGLPIAVADPINLIPIGGAVAKTYKAGNSILSAGMITGAVASASSAVQEAALHSTQLERTLGESAINVGASFLLGGAIGAGGAKLSQYLSKSDLREIERSMNVEPRIADGENTVLDLQSERIKQEAEAAGITPEELSVGAAQVASGQEVSGKAGKFLAKALGFDPLSRTLVSASPETRRIANMLAENPYKMDGPAVTAVESRVKIKDGYYADALQGHYDAFRAYRKRMGQSAFSIKTKDGVMKKLQFNEAVARAIREGKSDIPEVDAAAKAWQEKLYEPIKNELIEAKLLPEDVDVSTAVNYLNRRWNKQKVAANMPQFIKTTTEWLDEQTGFNREVQAQVIDDISSIETSARRVKSLENSVKTYERQIATLEKQLSEIQREQKAGVARKITVDESAVKKEIKRIKKIDEQARKAMLDEFAQYQEKKIASLSKARDKAIRALEKQIKDIDGSPRGRKIGRVIAELGGLNRDAWEAEGIDPAFFRDKTIKGGFGKPVFRAEGGLTPDGLAEKLSEMGIIREFDSNLAVDYVDDFLRNGDDYFNPEVRMEVEAIQETIDDIYRSTDEDIINVYFGGRETVVPEAPGEAAKIKVPTAKATDRELLIARNRLNARANKLRDQLSDRKYKLEENSFKLQETQGNLTTVIANLESNVSQWKGKTSARVKSAIKNRDLDAIPSLTKSLKKSAKTIAKKDLEDIDNEDIAKQIAQRIMGTPDGKLPYDWKMGEGSSSGKTGGIDGLRGPLKSRTFQIPDNMIEDFLDNNIEDLGRMYLRQTAADLELVKEFGDVRMTAQLKEIEDWYGSATNAAKTEKQRLALQKSKEADIRDVAAMRDRIRGVYGDIDPDNIWVRTGRAARNLNYLRFMGGIVASSVPDVARIFMAEGIGRTFSKGLLPLAKNLKTFKVSAAEAKRYGVGVDALMGGRSQIIADIVDYTQPGTAFERGLQSMTDNFGRINMMDYWTASVKQLHAVTMQNGVIDDLLKGKIDKRLNRLGISDADAEGIARQLQKHAEKVDGVWISNAKNWDSPALYEKWGAAIRKESDRVIVVPGQEKPLFMSSELGKTILQFRSFMFASTQRMTIAALQGQDHNAVAGVLMLTSIGMMSYAFKQWDAGREIADDPIELVIEGIDRAGVTGILMEINNTTEKMSSNNFGLRPLLGIERGAARFVSRSMSENLLGPTVGSLLDTTLRVANAGLKESGWDDSDTRALRRLIPYQNLTFIRQGFDTIEEKVGGQ